jgi:hypothetical protein
LPYNFDRAVTFQPDKFTTGSISSAALIPKVTVTGILFIVSVRLLLFVMTIFECGIDKYL